ncbi:MAG TPA: ATP-binding cassette domain-containing protein [Dehalococcoidia bacterium]|nr:ATP-binding cassette domain-containing protein [Dehalococcoidia bacterium]
MIRPESAPGVHVRDLRYTPPAAARPALDGVSLDLAPGEFLAVLGHNGSGKSTLARHLAGLVTPQEGDVRVDGLSTTIPRDCPRVRRLVGLVFQNPDHQIVGASVAEDVLWGMPAGLSPSEALRRTDEALAAVGLTGYEGQPTWRLSGGQKQRLALAGVLARGPRYLVCDEPTALLDARSREEARALLLSCRERGLGLLWITHRIEEALLADRIIVLKAGRIVAAGAPRTIAAALPEAAIALPQLTALAARLRRAGLDVTDLPSSPEQLAEQLSRLLADGTAAEADP